MTRFVAFGFSVLLTGLCGCGGSEGPQLGQVSGKITMEKRPLEGAQVMFYPEEGRFSMGHTNSSGEYTLQYTPDRAGAIVGKHVVRITTATQSGEGDVKPTEEMVPSQYNVSSQLTAEVKAGSNTISFDLD